MKEKNSKKFRGEIVKKDNILNEGIHTIDTAEKYKLMLLMIAQIATQDELPKSPEKIANKTYSFYIDDYAELKNIKNKYWFEDYVSNMIQYLKEKSAITIKSEDSIKTIWIFQDVEFKREKGKWKVSYRFSYPISEFLFELKNKFIAYHIKNIMPMRSKYSIRLYELLKQYEKIGERTFDINEFREKIGTRIYIIDNKTGEKKTLQDDYKDFRDLKRWVIERAIKEVNKFSDIEITNVEYNRKGRKIEFITFYFKSKINFNFQMEEKNEKEEKEKNKTSEKQNNKLPIKTEIIWKNIGELRKHYKKDIKEITEYIKELQTQKSLKNLKEKIILHELTENQILFLLINADKEIYDTEMTTAIIKKAIKNKKIENIMGFLINTLNIDIKNAKFKELLNIDEKLDEELLEKELVLVEEDKKEKNRKLLENFPKIPQEKAEKIIAYIFNKIIPEVANDKNIRYIVEFMIKGSALDKENKLLYLPVENSSWDAWYEINLKDKLEELIKVKTKTLEV